MISPELKLAIDCCRCAFIEATPESPRDDLSRIDWNLFVEVVRRHRVQGFAWQALNDRRIAIPCGPARLLTEDTQSIAEQNLRAAVESKAILERFSASGVPLLFIKGLSTAALAYRKPLLKMSWDLDILIAPQDLAKAATDLEEAGFRPAIPLVPPITPRFLRWHEQRKESVWYKPGCDLFLELHTRLSANRELLAQFTVKSTSQLVTITPGIAVPTFALDELIVYIAVHGSSSAWFRLKWAADFAGLLARSDSPSPEALYAHSLDLRVQPAVAQALIVADRLFGLPMTESLRSELTRSRTNRLFARLALRQLANLREPGARRFGTAANHLGQLFLRPGWRFKWSEILRQLADARSNRSIMNATTAAANLRAEAANASG